MAAVVAVPECSSGSVESDRDVDVGIDRLVNDGGLLNNEDILVGLYDMDDADELAAVALVVCCDMLFLNSDDVNVDDVDGCCCVDLLSLCDRVV